MNERFQVAKLTEMQLPQPAPAAWYAIRSHFDIRSFGVNAWAVEEAGTQVISEHDELDTQHEELFIVTSGRARFTVDGETIDAPAGTAVFVRDPAVKRGAVAEEDATTVLTVGGKPGVIFEPSKWERSTPALGFFASQEYDKAHTALIELHREDPNDAIVLYNLACAESRLDRTDEALGHLEQSIDAGGERFRELARTDSDLDRIRAEPRFKELVGG